MTLVALTYFHDSFLAISDSRVTYEISSKLEKFSKLFAHPYKFTSGPSAVRVTYTYSGVVGLAISGSTLFGSAFSNMFAKTIAEMHSKTNAQSPTFESFRLIAEHCAKVLVPSVISSKQCFELLIFGFDPRDNRPQILDVRVAPLAGQMNVSVISSTAHEDEIKSIGTGGKHLPKDLPRPSEVPLSTLVGQVISTQIDPATGGDIQAMRLDSEGAHFLGTTLQGRNWNDANYCGVERSDLGEIEGFYIGRSETINLRPHLAVRDLAQQKAEYIKEKKGEVARNLENFGPILSFLSYLHDENGKGHLSDIYQVEISPLISGSYYFSKICPTCWRNSPSILSPGSKQGFGGSLYGSGAIATYCRFCSASIHFKPEDFKRQILWNGNST